MTVSVGTKERSDLTFLNYAAQRKMNSNVPFLRPNSTIALKAVL